MKTNKLSALNDYVYEFHVAEGKSFDELIGVMIQEVRQETPPIEVTDKEIRTFILILKRIVEQAGDMTIKDVIRELEEDDNKGEEWKES